MNIDPNRFHGWPRHKRIPAWSFYITSLTERAMLGPKSQREVVVSPKCLSFDLRDNLMKPPPNLRMPPIISLQETLVLYQLCVPLLTRQSALNALRNPILHLNQNCASIPRKVSLELAYRRRERRAHQVSTVMSTRRVSALQLNPLICRDSLRLDCYSSTSPDRESKFLKLNRVRLESRLPQLNHRLRYGMQT